jgi:uncharacterized membrane protein
MSELRTGTVTGTVAEEAPGHYLRESLEFARIANLSDAVFAIAMTLLVLGLDVPDVRASELGGELASLTPHLLAFVLSFALVANIWWQHHKLFSRLAYVDRPLIALDLAVLGAVAVVPFPTGLLGSYPTSRAAVLSFIGIFVLLLALFVASIHHAQRVAAWTRPMPDPVYSWVVAGYLAPLAMMLGAAAITFISPLAALAVLACSSLPEVAFISRRAPAEYRSWA